MFKDRLKLWGGIIVLGGVIVLVLVLVNFIQKSSPSEVGCNEKSIEVHGLSAVEKACDDKIFSLSGDLVKIQNERNAADAERKRIVLGTGGTTERAAANRAEETRVKLFKEAIEVMKGKRTSFLMELPNLLKLG